MAEVSNLEAAFERITVNDENDEQLVSAAHYTKTKVRLHLAVLRYGNV